MELLKVKDGQKRQIKILNDQLFRAITDGGVQQVQKAIDDGADVNGIHTSGQRPITRAINTRSVPLVKVLLQNGAHVDEGMVVSEWTRRSELPPNLFTQFFLCGDTVASLKRRYIRHAIILAAELDNETCVQELYTRGAYRPLDTDLNDLDSRAQYLLNNYKDIARYRVQILHAYLDAALDGERNLEEVIRSFEIGKKKAGKDFYWGVVLELENTETE